MGVSFPIWFAPEAEDRLLPSTLAHDLFGSKFHLFLSSILFVNYSLRPTITAAGNVDSPENSCV